MSEQKINELTTELAIIKKQTVEIDSMLNKLNERETKRDLTGLHFAIICMAIMGISSVIGFIISNFMHTSSIVCLITIAGFAILGAIISYPIITSIDNKLVSNFFADLKERALDNKKEKLIEREEYINELLENR